MKLPLLLTIMLGASALGTSVFLSAERAAPAATAPVADVEPGGDAAGAQEAQNSPDEYAWKVFEYISRQASPGTAGEPDVRNPITKYDPDQPATWETWALASGDGTTQNGSEVYKEDGSLPSGWGELARGPGATKLFSANLKSAAFQQQLFINRMESSPQGMDSTRRQILGQSTAIGPLNPTQDFEVRLNKPAFEFVRANELYNVEGLQKQLATARTMSNRDLLQFPAAAKEIKANWILAKNPISLSEDEKNRFHWRKVQGKYYLLVALHVTTRDLKLWFWADFAQEDFETEPGPALPSRDSTTRGPNATRRGQFDGQRIELKGTKWAHYRLRGTQTNYVDAAGSPIIVGNTQIEGGFADKSSCMTCHFNASVGDGARPQGTVNRLPAGNPVVGTPDLGQLGSGTKVEFLQTDFVWSAPFRARHRK